MWENEFARRVLDPELQALEQSLADFAAATKGDASAAEDVLVSILDREQGDVDMEEDDDEDMDKDGDR